MSRLRRTGLGALVLAATLACAAPCVAGAEAPGRRPAPVPGVVGESRGAGHAPGWFAMRLRLATTLASLDPVRAVAAALREPASGGLPASSGRLAWTRLMSRGRTAAVGGALALLLALVLTLAAWPPPRAMRRRQARAALRVRGLARRGVPAGRIARRAGVERDAVRWLSGDGYASGRRDASGPGRLFRTRQDLPHHAPDPRWPPARDGSPNGRPALEVTVARDGTALAR